MDGQRHSLVTLAGAARLDHIVSVITSTMNATVMPTIIDGIN